jgi:hypothetical protein
METLIENDDLDPENNNSHSFKTNFKAPESFDLNAMLNHNVTGNKTPMVNANSTVAKNEEAAKPVVQETKNLDSLTQNNQQIDQFYQQELDKDRGVWDKLTNRKMYDQVQQVKGELFKTSSHYRLAFYKTLLDARLEALYEKCSAGTSMIKAHFRQKVASFLMSKMEELGLEVKDRQISFMEMMKTKYLYAETLTDFPSMQQRYSESIFDEEGRYLKFLDSLLIKFESIVDEQMRKYN